jgi:amidohydrolase
MIGTIRTLNEDMRNDIHRRITNTAQSIAQSAGASAEVTITRGYDVTRNDEKLAERSARSLRETVGDANVLIIPKVTASEDFSAYQRVIPGFFFFLGVVPPGTPPDKVFPNHSPRFWLDEAVLKVGMKTLANLTVHYLSGR